MLFPRHTTILIGGSIAEGSFLAGAATLLTEDATISQDGWDSLAATYAIRRATLTAEELAALYPIGAKLGARNWWVAGARPACIAEGVWTAEVTYKGWASTKPCKIQWGTAVEQQSASNVSAPVPAPGTGSATYAKVSTSESVPTFSFTYLSANVEAGWPSTPTLPFNRVGRERALSPGWTDPSTGSAITPPPLAASIWDSLGEYVYHWPNGWILMDLSVDLLPGTRVGLVTEGYKYVRPKTP